MIIGWGNIGYDWGRPIFTVLVRESRYTHGYREWRRLTISIPFDNK